MDILDVNPKMASFIDVHQGREVTHAWQLGQLGGRGKVMQLSVSYFCAFCAFLRPYQFLTSSIPKFAIPVYAGQESVQE